MTIDLTLDSIMIPAIAGYTPPFGTKKASGGLSTQEVNDNIIAGFAKQRPVIVSESASTSEIQYNATLAINTAGITLTLGSGAYVGCEVTVIAKAVATISCNSGSIAISTRSGEKYVLTWDGTAWIVDSHENNPAGYIGMRIEGGGIIFFDYKYGYKYGSLSVAPKTNLKSYHVDKATNVVVCDNPGDTSKSDRFYVVQEFDIGEYKHGTCLQWGSTDCAHLYNVLVGTSTDFGQGYHNTELCIAAANADNALEWNEKAYKNLWHYLWKGDWQYRSPKWFLPSKDELNVLLNMQWQDSARWRGYNNEILKRIPVNFYSYYWSSSESSATIAHGANFYNGTMGTNDKNSANDYHVRLCRTF